jgi:hypothetical protein
VYGDVQNAIHPVIALRAIVETKFSAMEQVEILQQHWLK